MNLIFVSIASYLDTELKQTVTSLLSNAVHPENIFLSIYSQERENDHPDIESICNKYKSTCFYVKDDFRNSKGTCFARSVCQKPLTNFYKYYLQIDSHTIFVENWDQKLITDYERSRSRWDDLIFSTYPLSYQYKEKYDKNTMGDNLGEYFLETKDNEFNNCLEITTTDHFSKYSGKYIPYLGDDLGYETNYLAAGFAFGYAKYFIDTPYDERIYHSGEEPSLSIRFYCKGVTIACPPKVYCYHHFAGGDCNRRQSHWVYDEAWDKESHQKVLDESHRSSEKTLEMFYKLELDDDDPFRITNVERYKQWLLLVKERTE